MVDGKWINFSNAFKQLLDIKKERIYPNQSYNITLDSKGKITYIESVVEDSVKATESITSPPFKPSQPPLDVRAREILKGQALNLVFTNLEGNIKSKEWRTEAISLSAVLFAELQNAGYLKW
jgi:hypothetical protein